MSDPTNTQRSADILAFRPRVKVPDCVADASDATALADASAEDPQLRLQRALAALDAALTRQKTAVADWRASMAQLGSQVDGLGGSLQGLHASLGGLQVEVSQLHGSAIELEAHADRLLAITTGQLRRASLHGMIGPCAPKTRNLWPSASRCLSSIRRRAMRTPDVIF